MCIFQAGRVEINQLILLRPHPISPVLVLEFVVLLILNVLPLLNFSRAFFSKTIRWHGFETFY